MPPPPSRHRIGAGRPAGRRHSKDDLGECLPPLPAPRPRGRAARPQRVLTSTTAADPWTGTRNPLDTVAAAANRDAQAPHGAPPAGVTQVRHLPGATTYGLSHDRSQEV